MMAMMAYRPPGFRQFVSCTMYSHLRACKARVRGGMHALGTRRKGWDHDSDGPWSNWVLHNLLEGQVEWRTASANRQKIQWYSVFQAFACMT